MQKWNVIGFSINCKTKKKEIKIREDVDFISHYIFSPW